MQSGTRMFTVDKFLGINQSGDGTSELRMGEASVIQNFNITDGFNLALRPGVQRFPLGETREPAQILSVWAGHISENASTEHLVVVDFYEGTDRIWLYTKTDSGEEQFYSQAGALGLKSPENHLVKAFPFGGKLWIMSRGNIVAYEGGQFVEKEPYIPLVIAGAAPEGGGETMENINLLTGLRRITYSADGTSTAYVLPEEAISVETVSVDNLPQTDAGTFDQDAHTFTFITAPEKGVGNVEFTYDTYAADADANRLAILEMPLVEAYNGSADTRLFVGGKGNVCYYTGVPSTGR